MALIKCPKCGRDVSENAESCPACGFPIASRKIENEKHNCPECGCELDNNITICTNCGYNIEVKKEIVISKNVEKGRRIRIASVVIACVFFILAVTRISNDKYTFYKEHYAECMDEYEENSKTARSSSGMFKSSYNYISNSYKDMADSDMKEIWKFRVEAIVLSVVGVVVIISGVKIAKKKEGE